MAQPSLIWMAVYLPEDFTHVTLSELFNFLKGLRIPIPPVIGLAEILSIRFTGSAEIITKYLYRIGLVGGYLLAITLASKSTIRLLASFFISVVFLYATVKIHPGNPQDYDVLCPTFFLLYVFLIEKSVGKDSLSRNKTVILILTFLSGFFLSMAELSRPYVIYILPLFVIFSYFIFREGSVKYQFIVFLAPVILISGLWHFHLFINLGQIPFSNHSGFNLSKVWPIQSNGLSEEIPEIHNEPLFEGVKDNVSSVKSPIWGQIKRRANLNTVEHTMNSNLKQSAIFKYWIENPRTSFFHAITRIDDLLTAKTNIYTYDPQFASSGLYKLLVKVTASLLFVNFGILLLYVIQHLYGLRFYLLLTKADNLILIFAVYCIVTLAISDTGEEARFLISVLPLLAALPVFTAPEISTIANVDLSSTQATDI
jgi:hypothetical protein